MPDASGEPSPRRERARMEPSADDLVSRPWEYPGTGAAYSGLLHPGGYRPLAASAVDGLLGRDDRHLLVAVGANASPAVIRRKLDLGGVSSTVPFLQATVTGLRIGHSGHVSTSGYVAATPVRAQTDRGSSVVALLLDPAQLEWLDTTEPNYERALLPAQACQLHLGQAALPEAFSVYLSRWGALVDQAGSPLGLTTQEAVFDWLRNRCPPVGELLGRWPELPATMRALAGDAGLRLRVKEMLNAGRCVAPTGFEGVGSRSPAV